MSKQLVGVIIGLLVIIVGLQTYTLVRDTKTPEVSTSSPSTVSDAKPAGTVTANQGRPRIETYRDAVNGFELDYDGAVFTKEVKDGYINVPPAIAAQKISEVTLVRYASHPMSNWGTGQKIQDRTDNPRIRLSVIPVPYATYEAYIYETFDDGSIEKVSIGGRKGIRYWMGAEGEGHAYYCIPLQDQKTLCINYNTIDGQFVRVYRTVSDFASFDQQRALVESVLETLRFIK